MLSVLAEVVGPESATCDALDSARPEDVGRGRGRAPGAGSGSSGAPRRRRSGAGVQRMRREAEVEALVVVPEDRDPVRPRAGMPVARTRPRPVLAAMGDEGPLRLRGGGGGGRGRGDGDREDEERPANDLAATLISDALSWFSSLGPKMTLCTIRSRLSDSPMPLAGAERTCWRSPQTLLKVSTAKKSRTISPLICCPFRACPGSVRRLAEVAVADLPGLADVGEAGGAERVASRSRSSARGLQVAVADEAK